MCFISMATNLWNNAVCLVKNSECFISELHSYASLKFVYDIAVAPERNVLKILCLHFSRCHQCTRKKSLNVHKVAQNDFTTKMIDFDIFTKIA